MRFKNPACITLGSFSADRCLPTAEFFIDQQLKMLQMIKRRPNVRKTMNQTVLVVAIIVQPERCGAGFLKGLVGVASFHSSVGQNTNVSVQLVCLG